MSFRFSGHETFPCRYAWLPKAYEALTENPRAFTDEEEAMILLGVGKNMARAIRFWVQAVGVAEPSPNGYAITPFGRALMGKRGFDPFLEDARTLWLVHWRLAAHVHAPLFAWDFLLNRWPSHEFTRSAAMRQFTKETIGLERPLSPITLQQHFDTFVHTYVPTKSRKGEIQEDNLDCPLVELELIRVVGERKLEAGRTEPIFAFQIEPKADITPHLFAYCLDDFWNLRKPHERTLSFRDVSVGHGSPGQIFKLPEWEVRQRLETIKRDTQGAFEFRDSVSFAQITRGTRKREDFLKGIYA